MYVFAIERQLCYIELATYFIELAHIVICSEVQIFRLFITHDNSDDENMPSQRGNCSVKAMSLSKLVMLVPLL